MGKAGAVKIRTKTTPKLEERGITCMMVVHATDHEGDCCEMLNLQMNQVLLSRDAQWLNRMHFDGDKANEEDEGKEELIIDNDEMMEQPQQPVTQQPMTQQPVAQTATAMTRSERAVKASTRLPEEMEVTAIDEVSKIMAVGAGIGGGFVHTNELRSMKCDESEAIKKDPVGWGKTVDKEDERMTDHVVFKAVPKNQVPKNAKIPSSAWAMKQKADGTLRARVTACQNKQQAGEHCEETGVSSPVVNEALTFITLTLTVLAKMCTELNGVHGAFSEGSFSHGENHTCTHQKELRSSVHKIWHCSC